MIKRLKHTARLFALSGMIAVSSIPVSANEGCYDGTQCPDGSHCCEVGKPVKDINGVYDFERIDEWKTGSYVCLAAGPGEGDVWYNVGGIYLTESDYSELVSDNALGEIDTADIFHEIPPVPLTDAILPLTLALGVYSWVIRRRGKKH